jgi:Heparinase II/III-like protein/Heparinase II/III N-terminus
MGGECTRPAGILPAVKGLLRRWGAAAVHRPALPDVSSFRTARLSAELRPYEAFLAGDRWGTRRGVEADLTLSEGWKRGSLPRLRLEPPVDWEGACASNRSWHFHLHSWEPIGLVLSAYQHLEELRYLDYSVALALDWIRRYPSTRSQGAFAWYDMAIGLRAYRLGYLLDVASRDERYRDETIALLAGSAIVHAQALLDDSRFASHSNHGLYQATGQLALALRFPELPHMAAGRLQGRTRLTAMITSQFADDGLHREHSPGYHYLLLDTLERVVECQLIEDPHLLDVVARARQALAWLTMPNQRLVTIGDTSARAVRGEPFDRSPDSALRFVATGGRDGAAPKPRLQAFATSGLVVMRDRWPEGPDDFGDCSYLAQTAAFHSRAHKHADDLSFVWFDRGRELLVDAGRYGYLGRIDPDSELGRQGFTYSDPNRIYVESTRAHNTVEIDGLSHPRRFVEPYGSAVLDWGDRDGVMYSECLISIHDTVEHRRILLFRPGSWVVVVDALADKHQRRHHYSQRFHFAPELDAVLRDRRVEAQLPDDEEALWMAPLLAGSEVDGIARGQTEPDLLGFVSRDAFEMIPAPTAAYRRVDASTAVFATLLSFDEPLPELGLSELDPGGRRGILRWITSRGDHELVLTQQPRERLALHYAESAR